MPKIEDIEVHRHYKCRNPECEAEIVKTQKCTEDFIRICPFCGKEEFSLVSGTSTIIGTVDLQEGKTIGSIAEKNTQRRLKEGTIKPEDALNWQGKKKKPRPWWRKTDKPDFSILKNPKKYMES